MNDTLSVIDALYRFAAGIDLRDPALLASAFADDAVSDFRPAAARAGFEYPVLEGKERIVAALSASLAQLDTTHSVSNPRVTVDGDAARIDALVEAQHVSRSDPSRHYLMKNRYDVELARRGTPGSSGASPSTTSGAPATRPSWPSSDLHRATVFAVERAGMKATIWHNPRCSKSREALALLTEAGAETTVVEYLATPPARAELARVYARAGLSPRDALRKDAPAVADDDAALDLMARDPSTIERPVVETEKGVRLGRPPERIREIL